MTPPYDKSLSAQSHQFLANSKPATERSVSTGFDNMVFLSYTYIISILAFDYLFDL